MNISEEAYKWVVGVFVTLLAWSLRMNAKAFMARIEKVEKTSAEQAAAVRNSVDFLRRYLYRAMNDQNPEFRDAALETAKRYLDRWRDETNPDGYRDRQAKDEGDN